MTPIPEGVKKQHSSLSRKLLEPLGKKLPTPLLPTREAYCLPIAQCPSQYHSLQLTPQQFPYHNDCATRQRIAAPQQAQNNTDALKAWPS